MLTLRLTLSLAITRSEFLSSEILLAILSVDECSVDFAIANLTPRS